jgi:hypothetical protein
MTATRDGVTNNKAVPTAESEAAGGVGGAGP